MSIGTPDYVYETRDSWERWLADVTELATAAEAEADRAKRTPGLEGPSRAAQNEADQARLLADEIRAIGARIDQGYPFWDREGFESAVDAVGESWSWHPLSEDLSGAVYAHDIDLRLPSEVQDRYVAALATRLFGRFVVCGTYETDGDTAVLASSYYLFGVVDSAILGASHFLMSQWATAD